MFSEIRLATRWSTRSLPRLARRCIVLLAGAHASLASGANELEPIRIEYSAEAGSSCPSAAEFAEQVFARTASARAATPGESARTYVVELRREAAGVAGSLVIREQNGATTARRVNGSECADVSMVLALATALAIDPLAELVPRQTLEHPQRGERPQEARQPAPIEVAPAAAPDSEVGLWLPRWSFGMAAAFAVAPRPAFGASLLGSLQRRGLPGVTELGLELVYRQVGAALVEGARAAFHFYAARPTLCAWGVELGVPLRAAPCLVGEVGAVTGVGSEIPYATAQTRVWSSLEVLLRFELALGSAWFMTLEAGAAAPLTRYQFVFDNPDTAIHEVPTVIATSALRVGTSF